MLETGYSAETTPLSAARKLAVSVIEGKGLLKVRLTPDLWGRGGSRHSMSASWMRRATVG